jgi:hypothetical protein
MSKKLGPLMIGLVAVALVAGCNRSESPRTQSQNDSAVVAGKNTPPTPSPNSAANPAGSTSEPGATAGTNNPGATPGKDQYSADLRKCDAMPESDRARCVEQAKKQHGQM